jgi:hypothetical protein
MKKFFFILLLFIYYFSFGQQKKLEKIKIIWNDCDSLHINYSYLSSIPEREKAAIAFVALHDSRDCEWDGEVNKDMSNLSCKIIKALGLGYQCSQKHIALLQKWLGKDSLASEEIKYCPMTPNTSHSVEGIDKIFLTKINNDKFKIDYSSSGMNIRSMWYWSFNTTIIFQMNKDTLKIVSYKKYKVKKKRIEE